ncbi:hypothetical protein ACF0H5_010830 [Mactra antiquata]
MSSDDEKGSRPVLSRLEIHEMKEMFTFFDKNNDGKLDKDELKKVFQAKLWNDKFLEDIFKNADIDGNSVLDYDEYVKLLKSLLKDENEDKTDIRNALRKHDEKGKIAKRHLLDYLSDFSIPNVNDLVKKADRDGTGHIVIEDFLNLLVEL